MGEDGAKARPPRNPRQAGVVRSERVSSQDRRRIRGDSGICHSRVVDSIVTGLHSMSDIAETLRHAGLASPQRVASPFEFWPAPLFYAPVAAYWAWQALRYRSVTLPSIANPLMEYGGLCGKTQTELFESRSPEGRQWLAPYVSLERGPAARLAADLAELLRLAAEAGLPFPLVAKPDIGCHGAGVQVVRDAAELKTYLAGFP